jgi:hypothetical protein
MGYNREEYEEKYPNENNQNNEYTNHLDNDYTMKLYNHNSLQKSSYKSANYLNTHE